MTDSLYSHSLDGRLRLGIVVGAGEERCTVFARGHPSVVAYAAPFPRPRADRVSPGHLVAIATAADGSDVVVWRWFDAVVLRQEGEQVRIWEPGHGEVLADARDPRRAHQPGSRAYVSAGLDGADWWMAGPAVASAEDADVEVEEVHRFLTAHGLWQSLT